MPLLWLSVPTGPDGASDRGVLERNAIALLSEVAGGEPVDTASWLGRHAAAAKVRQSSLWNVNHVNDRFDPHSLDLLEMYIAMSADSGRTHS
jgi:hypothetical protein